MDTITHGIAGALIGKAVFGGNDLFSLRPMNRERVITWALMIGSIFPDADVFRDMLSKNDMLMITWHRSITHSLLCLPIFAVLLAVLTHWFVRWRKWESPSLAALTGIYAAGIFSHILLDLVTTFGTMIWSPLDWARPAWDLLFIVDFSFTGILLIPQLLEWVNRDSLHAKRRALIMWIIFVPSPFLIAAIGRIVGAPISDVAIIAASLFFFAAFSSPRISRLGSPHQTRHMEPRWIRCGLPISWSRVVRAPRRARTRQEISCTRAHPTASDRRPAFSAFDFELGWPCANFPRRLRNANRLEQKGFV